MAHLLDVCYIFIHTRSRKVFVSKSDDETFPGYQDEFGNLRVLDWTQSVRKVAGNKGAMRENRFIASRLEIFFFFSWSPTHKSQSCLWSASWKSFSIFF